MSDVNKLLRKLPKVDLVLDEMVECFSESIPHSLIKTAIQQKLAALRAKVIACELTSLPRDEKAWKQLFKDAVLKKHDCNYKRVINGTGVVVHTNLGRSLLGEESLQALQMAAASYTNLELDLATGKRGSRYSLVEDILCDLTGAEAALVVNNNAAAVLLTLNTLSFMSETIVSRGQLVEIGGSFRIPDVMARSGAQMVEIGATNRTHLRDYENAITENTALLLKVHTSNFRLVGFTAEVSATDMVALAKKHGLPVMEDLGSGSLIDLSPYGLPKEPTVQEIIKEGIDVVTFSGDKLLGGPQAGIIAGKKAIIERIKKNPMNRALRIDKFTLSALETVLKNYYDLDVALENVPTLRLLTLDSGKIKKMGQAILRRLGGAKKLRYCLRLEETTSRVGGGAMPEYGLKSWALILHPQDGNGARLEKRLRKGKIPILGRMENERIVLDLRTILPTDIADLCNVLKTLLVESEK